MTTTPTPSETPRPIAYAIYGINAAGRHYIYEVKTPKDDEWKTDDGGLGDRWSGNEPLVAESRIADLTKRLETAEAEVETTRQAQREEWAEKRKALKALEATSFAIVPLAYNFEHWCAGMNEEAMKTPCDFQQMT